MNKALSEQEIVRRESLQKLRDLGIEPYPAARFDVDSTSKQIKENYKEGKEQNVVIAGRLMSRRIMGKASFAELQDTDGRIQLYVNRDEICQGEDKIMYNKVFKKLLDIGDIIGIKGVVFVKALGIRKTTERSSLRFPAAMMRQPSGNSYSPILRSRVSWYRLACTKGGAALSMKYVAGLSPDDGRNPLMIAFQIRYVKRLSATSGDTSPTYGP